MKVRCIAMVVTVIYILASMGKMPDIAYNEKEL